MVFRVLVLALLVAVQNTNSNAANEDETSYRDDIHEQLVDLQHRHVDWLFDHPDVTAVDVNFKTVGGKQTDQLSLVIWVKKKLPEEEVPEERRLPRELMLLTQLSATVLHHHPGWLMELLLGALWQQRAMIESVSVGVHLAVKELEQSCQLTFVYLD